MKCNTKAKTLYAVVVFLSDGIQVYRTTDRGLMLAKVREAATARQQYTVLTNATEV